MVDGDGGRARRGGKFGVTVKEGPGGVTKGFTCRGP